MNITSWVPVLEQVKLGSKDLIFLRGEGEMQKYNRINVTDMNFLKANNCMKRGGNTLFSIKGNNTTVYTLCNKRVNYSTSTW